MTLHCARNFIIEYYINDIISFAIYFSALSLLCKRYYKYYMFAAHTVGRWIRRMHTMCVKIAQKRRERSVGVSAARGVWQIGIDALGFPCRVSSQYCLCSMFVLYPLAYGTTHGNRIDMDAGSRAGQRPDIHPRRVPERRPRPGRAQHRHIAGIAAVDMRDIPPPARSGAPHRRAFRQVARCPAERL